MNRDAIKAHADAYWYRPCRDGNVWLWSAPIVVSAEMQRRGLSSAEWTAVFLNYDEARYIDGLYLVRNSLIPVLPQRQYYAGNLPAADCIQVRGWAGLNDCAHFVSECLTAGRVSVWHLGVGGLVQKLRELGDTRTLGYFVDADAAERIIGSGIMKPGDVIAFGTSHKTFSHGHSTIFMGDGKVANHSHLNHPSFTGGKGWFGGGVWRPYTEPTTGHPLVILIHFSDDDAPRSPATAGWWRMTWRSQTYYYYFERSGRAYWTRRAPVTRVAGPGAFEGRGYWFDFTTQVKIAWTATGTLEVHSRQGVGMTGVVNDTEAITGSKMT